MRLEPLRGRETDSAAGESVGSGSLSCPRCGNGSPLPIVYGPPNQALMALAAAGQIVPGGAMGRLLGGDAPTWQCAACRERWRGGLFVGGSGESVEQAVIIQGIGRTAVGIRAEKQYLTERFGLDAQAAHPGAGWTLERQALIHHDGGPHDALTISLPDGSERTVFFEVSGFFGRRP